MPKVKKKVEIKKVNFDHGKPTVIIHDKNVRYLEQAGEKWSYAEFDIPSKKWLPEPKLLDLELVADLKALPELQKISKMLKEIQKLLSNVLPELELIKTKEAFVELETTKISGLSGGNDALTGEDNGQ